MKHLIFLALTITSINAYATGNHGQQTSGNQAQNANLNSFQSTTVKTGAESTAISGAMANGGAAYSNSQGGAGGQGGKSFAASGDSSAASGDSSASGGNASNSAINRGNSVQFNQVQQTPFAYAPGLAQSFSQDNCANTASIGVSAGFGAISGGAPVESDACNRRKDVTLWLVTGQNRIACERMTDDDANMEAMKRAGMDCKALTEIKPPVNVPANRDLSVYDKMDAIADKQIQFINKKLGK